MTALTEAAAALAASAPTDPTAEPETQAALDRAPFDGTGELTEVPGPVFTGLYGDPDAGNQPRAQPPSVGRIVRYMAPHIPGNDPPREEPAIVTRVWSDDCVNLRVLHDSDRHPSHVTSVPRRDDAAFHAGDGFWWDWPERI